MRGEVVSCEIRQGIRQGMRGEVVSCEIRQGMRGEVYEVKSGRV